MDFCCNYVFGGKIKHEPLLNNNNSTISFLKILYVAKDFKKIFVELRLNSGNNGLEYDFDNVSFHGIELVGTIPLNPRVIIFLESKGNTIIQNNERITFHGDLVNAFTENEVTEFLATAEPAVSKPRPQL